MHAQNPHHARRWTILGVLGIAQLMAVLDITVVNIALPSAQAALHFGNDQRQWIITAYALAFGSLLLLGGKIGDLFGRKRTFIAGLIGFAVASALGGAAQSFATLALARALQGASGAVLAPSALSLLVTTFTDTTERNRAIGIFAAIGVSGASIGLLLGGALTQLLDWRAVMFVNLLFAGAAVVGALALLHNQVPAEKPRLDLPGVVTVSSGLFALVYGLSHAESTSWADALTRASLVAGLLLLACFIWIERRTAEPLLPLRIITDRSRSASFISILISSSSIFGLFLFLTYYMQQNLGYSPIATGLAFLPNSLLIMTMATFASVPLQRRFRPGILVATGMTINATALLYLTRLGVNATYATDILPALLTLGIGMGMVFPANMSNATRGVQPGDAGVVSASISTSQQIGGSIGIALLSTIAAGAATAYLAANTAAGAAQAAVHGYTTAFGCIAAALAVGAVLALLLFARPEDAEQPSDASADDVAVAA